MGGMQGLRDALAQLLVSVGIHLPRWTGPALGVFLLLVFLPNIIKNAKVDQARRMMGKLQDLTPEARGEARDRILEMAADNPVGLVAIADEALRRNQSALAREAVARLIKTGQRTSDVRRLQKALDGDKPKMPMGEVIAIEQLVTYGAVDAARARLEMALQKWPDEPELQALADKLAPPSTG